MIKEILKGMWQFARFLFPDFGGFNISEGMTRWKPR